MKYQGKDYKMTLNLDAVFTLEEAGMKLGEVLNGKISMKQTVTLACVLLNAGLDTPVFNDEMLCKIIKPGALKSLYAEINGALKDGMRLQTIDDSKPRDLYLEEIEAKKAEA